MAPSAEAVSISVAARPFALGTGKPHTCAQRSSVASSLTGAQPTSAPPCTPEWPRIGIKPQRSRPTKPLASATLMIERTLSSPHSCCVTPMLQTKTAVSASPSIRASSSISSREDPESRSSASHGCSSSAAATSAKPVV
jgi:hypothetical protein